LAVEPLELLAPAMIQIRKMACTTRKNHMKTRLRFFTVGVWGWLMFLGVVMAGNGK
jgi:hypothetical protein